MSFNAYTLKDARYSTLAQIKMVPINLWFQLI